MRLLQDDGNGGINLTKEYLDDDIPPYAILSHTWGPEEVTLEELMDGRGEGKMGYEKIRFCGRQALRDGLQYFWVDTCCIDKTSSAELQEAINCMYRWYRNAVKCYVYLADVSKPNAIADDRFDQWRWNLAFQNSRWFTRGWTLQELIAPKSVEFFSQEGTKLGSKKSLEDVICETTGLPSRALRGSRLPNFSVSERMSWAEQRNTTRPEDKAYSLLGIFDIHMPLLYGEGAEKAFRRLQEEVAKNSRTDFSAPNTYQPRCFKCLYPYLIETKKLHQLKANYQATNLDIIPAKIIVLTVANMDTIPMIIALNVANMDTMPMIIVPNVTNMGTTPRTFTATDVANMAITPTNVHDDEVESPSLTRQLFNRIFRHFEAVTA